MKPIVSRGFHRRHPASRDEGRTPPGQYLTEDFPVLTYGPTPRVSTHDWSFEIRGLVGSPRRFSWAELHTQEQQTFTADIHCVTKWSKLDTSWTGVPVDTLLEGVEPRSRWVTVFADGDYTTNLPLAELTGGRAWLVHTYEGEPLAPEHGGPARLLVPGLYLWKSAKWARGLVFTERDEPGFWEQAGYNNVGDPWRERRYAGD